MPATAPTPPQVATAALIPDALPAEGIALLGTFTKPDGATALIRTSSGALQTLRTGDTLGQYQITAISDGQINLVHRDGSPAQLAVPPAA